MLASLLRPKKKRQVYADRSPFSSRDSPWPAWANAPRRRDFGTDDEDHYHHPALPGNASPEDDSDPGEEDEEAAGGVESTLLPIFSASHLDSLPVYGITHAIRPLITSRCETTLTWDQLRSPQISQFLVKPIQQQIRSEHFSRATLYALLTNCLQFSKEVHRNPGNSGTSQTRAIVSELLAIKLLREYSSRELIDALSYEFYPLQGHHAHETEAGAPRSQALAGIARISCLEIAIRAQAKRFLSHPLVVQQLEAIWAGTIVFHSAADHLHRAPASRNTGGGSASETSPLLARSSTSKPNASDMRRSVTLYDPRDASLFKLSRLRVPRYRQFLSTLSFAVLLALFLAVLQQRRLEITTLEVVFWLWSAGFMLDELVGFNEQGFSLYLMSFWNMFDLGILFLLFCYYCMRLWGAVMPYTRNPAAADLAYDILAANAVLLFPRLFSILDHYRYFSQLLIAFRIMASDLVAVFLLIIIACSGFFVAFTLSFGTREDHTPGSVAYALFQILMGFSPAAWTLWEDYNPLGKIVLTIFLFICHFVVVTILITVLTNSFMGIVQNANQEHQFLFAVNAISMVKSDALFSYVAPTNILAWLIAPLRFFMPFRQFVRINRTMIKITHLPILFTICLYEKTMLSSRVFDTDHLTLHPDSVGRRPPRPSRFRTFNRARLVREPSVATYQKDRALEEVFRHHRADETASPLPRVPAKQSRNIHNWMQEVGSGPIHAPDEQDSDEMNQLERSQRPRDRLIGRLSRLRDVTASHRSARSNPEDQFSHIASSPAELRHGRGFLGPSRTRQISQHTGMEGDDERDSDSHGDDEDRPGIKTGVSPGKSAKFYSSRPSTARGIKSRKNSPNRRRHHLRNLSGATMLYNPVNTDGDDNDNENHHDRASSIPVRPRARTPDGDVAGGGLSASADQWPRRRGGQRSREGPVTHSNPMSVPDRASFPTPSGLHHAMGSDLGDNKAIVNGFLGGVPSSFTTQMAYATGGMREAESPRGNNQDMLSKLVLARMNNLEEGFREVIREVKDLRGDERKKEKERKKRTKLSTED